MSERIADDWITLFMKYTDNSEPPSLYREWTAVSVLGAALQRKVFLRWEGTFYPNLYVVLVGPSGSRKGTAMRPGKELLNQIGVKLSAEAITREALIRRLKKSNDQMIKDGRVYLHASLTIFSEELTVFLGYNNRQLMSDLSDWFDCSDHWTYETKGKGTDEISNIWVSLLGATTPELLRTTLPYDAIGGGLTSRIIFVFEEKREKTIIAPFKTPEEIEIERVLLHDLEMIHMYFGDFKVTDKFMECWAGWYPSQENEIDYRDPRFEGYVNRRATHILKLSMIVNVSRKGGRLILDDVDFDRAHDLLRRTEKKMFNTFRGVGKSDISDIVNDVMTTIALKRTISFSDLLSLYYNDTDKQTLKRVIETLEAMNYCKVIHSENGAVLKYLKKEGEQSDEV